MGSFRELIFMRHVQSFANLTTYSCQQDLSKVLKGVSNYLRIRRTSLVSAEIGYNAKRAVQLHFNPAIVRICTQGWSGAAAPAAPSDHLSK